MNEFEKLVLEKLETIGQRMDHVEEEMCIRDRNTGM